MSGSDHELQDQEAECHVPSGLCDCYIELFTWMAAQKF